MPPKVIDFSKPTNLKELANLFIGIDEELLKRAIDGKKKELFIQHRIPKKNKRRDGEVRVVWEAKPEIEDAYKSFARRFDLFARSVNPNFPHRCAYGYVRGRSTLDNASRHCAASKILHADIQNFFPSIRRDKIKNVFLNLGIKPKISDILSDFVTIDNGLPLGIPCSPLIANLVCLDLDDSFCALASSLSCDYTRYADDISISGENLLPKKSEIEGILKKYEFSLSDHKFRVTKKGQAHYVTGLSVTDSVPHAPRFLKKRLRQELYYCKKYGIEDHIRRIGQFYNLRGNVNRIDGMIRYISYIEPKSFSEASDLWGRLLEKEDLCVGYGAHIRKGNKFIFYVDECLFMHHEKNILALSIAKIRADDLYKIEVSTEKILRGFIVDPFSGGRKKSLEKKGLHYSDSSEDLRKLYTDRLSTFPFKAYVIYKALSSTESYSQTYLSMVRSIFPHRFMACDNADIQIIFEENPQVKSVQVREAVDGIYKNLNSSKNPHPKKIDVIVGKKADYPCFSVPDYLLGIFAGYATLNDQKDTERRELFFERLRDKYRLIIDADNSLNFHRKRPFAPLS